jgi:all-trans-retinol dehydrogenase (NAD+)
MSKGQVYAYQVDLTKREEIYRAADRVKQEVGKVRRKNVFVFAC